MTDLSRRNAIVTGAAVGIGNAYARALAAEGVNVAVCDVREEIHDLVADLDGNGIRACGWQADVTNPDDVRRVVDGATDAFGGIDILISNAGVWGGSVADDPLDKSIADYEHIVGVNLKGEYLFGRAVIPGMIAAGRGGDIVNIATDHMVTCGTPNDLCPNLPTCPWNRETGHGVEWAGPPRPTSGGNIMDLYDASKWGINGFTFAWAKALRHHSIRVNAICMGATDSHMLRMFNNFDPPESEVSTWMTAQDSAQVVIDLLKEGPEGRTGENLNLCVGRPCVLEPPLAPIYFLESDLNG